MKKRSLLLLSTLLVGLAATSCGNKEVMPVYYKSLNAGARTRDFKSDFDVMIDDFSSTTLKGTTSGDATFVNHSYLQVALDYEHPDTFPGDEDKSIYKQASGDYKVSTFDGIKFKMRVSKGKVKLQDLVLALRGADNLNVYELQLKNALDNDGEPLRELTSEYQDIIVSPMNSIDDENTVYTDKETNSPSTIKVLEEIIGFHLYAKGKVKGVIEIEEVSGIRGADETTFDDFNRLAPESAPHTWWSGSTGHIIARSVFTMKNGGYQITTTDDISSYENVVVSLKADTTDISLQPVLSSGAFGNRVTWSNLKDDQNTALVDPVNGCYGSYVVNLANSGLATDNITGFKIDVNGTSSIQSIFMTNMGEKEAVKEFPVLDVALGAVFDDFNRTQARIDESYDAAVLNPIVTENGLNYAISYHNKEMLSIGDGVLTFDATNLAENDYINFVEGSKTSRQGHKYMVISTKLEAGATLDNFRIEAGGKVVYYPDFYAAQGLPTSNENNPYVKDGFTWQVIDVELSGLSAIDGELVMYYSGVGKLLVDTIFFCSEPGLVKKAFSQTEGLLDTGADNTHQYLDLGVNEGAKQIEITFKGNGVANFESFRIEGAGDNAAIFANSGTLKMYVNDELITSAFVAPSDVDTVLLIDLEESGWTDFHTNVILVIGDWAPGYMNVSQAEMYLKTETLEWRNFDFSETVLAPTESNPHQWLYVGWSEGASVISLTVKGDGVATLASFRFELSFDGNVLATLYANDNLKMYVDGEAISADYVVPTEEVTITFDLKESGWTDGGVNINAVYGDFGNMDQSLTIISGQKGIDLMTPENIMNSVPEMIKGSETTNE